MPHFPAFFSTDGNDTARGLEEIRLLKTWCLVLSVALLVTLALMTVSVFVSLNSGNDASRAAASAKTAALAVSKIQHSSAVNRVHNVSVWCGAINHLQDELVSYVDHVVPRNDLRLTDLACHKIEYATGASSK
jgi:hypothetical protein